MKWFLFMIIRMANTRHKQTTMTITKTERYGYRISVYVMYISRPRYKYRIVIVCVYHHRPVSAYADIYME